MEENGCSGHVCHECGVSAPSVATDFTLVSVRHGWRLLRRTHGGNVTLEWRCRACWANRAEQRSKAAS